MKRYMIPAISVSPPMPEKFMQVLLTSESEGYGPAMTDTYVYEEDEEDEETNEIKPKKRSLWD